MTRFLAAIFAFLVGLRITGSSQGGRQPCFAWKSGRQPRAAAQAGDRWQRRLPIKRELVFMAD
jgi:hypothetical protein